MTVHRNWKTKRSSTAAVPDDEASDSPREAGQTDRSTRSTIAVGRRGYLGLLGAGAASSLLSSRPAVADTEQGYGVGEYGLGAYGGIRERGPIDESPDDSDEESEDEDAEQDTQLEVTTVSADAQASFATLSAHLWADEDFVRAYFEYRESGAAEWIATDDASVSDWGVFEQTVSDLSPSTLYEYRAVGESDSETVRGDTQSFQTLSQDSLSPSVDRFVVENVSESNDRVTLSIEWSVSDPDGDLETVTVVVADYRQTLTWDVTPVDGASASGSQEITTERSGMKTYEVTVAVMDTAGNLDVQRTQLQ